LREIIFFRFTLRMVCIFILVSIFTYAGFSVYRLVTYQLTEFVGEVCSDEIKKAMDKMGPLHKYKMIGETLYVDRDGDGKWLKLQYERK